MSLSISSLHQGVCLQKVRPGVSWCALRLPITSPVARHRSQASPIPRQVQRPPRADIAAPDRSCNLDLREPPKLLGRPPALGAHLCSAIGWPPAVPWGGLLVRGPIRVIQKRAKKLAAISSAEPTGPYRPSQLAGKEPGSQQVSPVATVATSNTQDG
ncbi:Nn.00g108640.m01.CDS01 [Neocucurbitaria sp. VM-36]